MNPTGPRVSVVLATYNRALSLVRLLGQLALQTLPPNDFEVIVVDDGSRVPVRGAVAQLSLPYRFRQIEQANAGAAQARHRGIEAASGDLLVIVDDDMQVPPTFLAAHLALHPPGSRRVVLGRMRPSAAIKAMPLFERFHAGALEKQSKLEPQRRLHGNALCTGNVSLRRAEYLASGGFDTTFQRSEDMDLGLRLELGGLEILFSEDSYTIHESDHTSFGQWRRRALLYGEYEVRIARKYPRLPWADPWRFFFGNAPLKRPFVGAAAFLPMAGPVLSESAYCAARVADAMGFEQVALAAVSLLWDLEYFTGVRRAVGGLLPALRSCSSYLRKAESLPDAAAARPSGAGAVLGRALCALIRPEETP